MTKEELVEKNMKLAYMLANRYYKLYGGKIEFEEIRSVSLLGLVKAANSFNESKGLAFSTFAFPCIKNEILIYLRMNKKHITTSLYSKIDDDFILADILCSNDNTEEKMLNNLEINLLYKYIDKLSELEKNIVIMYALQGKTMTEIGQNLGYSQPQISRIYAKALNKLRDKFKD